MSEAQKGDFCRDCGETKLEFEDSIRFGLCCECRGRTTTGRKLADIKQQLWDEDSKRWAERELALEERLAKASAEAERARASEKRLTEALRVACGSLERFNDEDADLEFDALCEQMNDELPAIRAALSEVEG